MKLNTILFLTLCFMLGNILGGIYLDKYYPKPVDKSKYIDKSQCIGLPSSDVNDYWACRKEVNE